MSAFNAQEAIEHFKQANSELRSENGHLRVELAHLRARAAEADRLQEVVAAQAEDMRARMIQRQNMDDIIDAQAELIRRIAVAVRGDNDDNATTQLDRLPDDIETMWQQWRELNETITQQAAQLEQARESLSEIAKSKCSEMHPDGHCICHAKAIAETWLAANAPEAEATK